MSNVETTETWSVGASAVSLFDRQLRGSCGAEAIAGNCKVDFHFEGKTFGSLPPHEFLPNGPPAVGKTGKTLFRALSGNLDEAIVVEALNGQTVRLQVAGQPLANSYVADASPVGEIFAANADLSMVIHRPHAGGIKTWERPASVVKLLGVIWM